MDSIEALNRYLEVAARARRDRGAVQPPLPFVTISRESGAGGRALAAALLEAFEARRGEALFQGWKVFDRALCELVAEDSELDVGLRSLLEESSLNVVQDVVATLLGRTPQPLVHRKVAETVRELALVGKTIIVGRGGASLTRDLPSGIHLRLVAPLALRVEREVRRGGGQAGEVERQVRERDRNRASLVERLTGLRIDDPLLYDAVCNTERTPLDLVVRAVEGWVSRLGGG